MAGEYFLFVYSLVLYPDTKSKVSRIAYGLLAFTCLVAIAFTRCRSAEIASAFITILYFGRLKGARFWIGPGFALITLALCFYLYKSSANKMNTVYQRRIIWGQTLTLIKDHPLGIGRHHFAFDFTPYRGGDSFGDDNVLASPHNEFLLTIAEDGAAYALLTLSVFVLLCRPVAHKLGRQEMSMLIALFLQMLFQFPLEDPFPFVITALCLGNGLRRYDGANSAFSIRANAIRWYLASAFLALAFRAVYPQWAVAQSRPDTSDLEFACYLNPLDSRACWALGAAEARQGDSGKCIAHMTEQVTNFPSFPIFRKVRAVCEFQKGDIAEGCADLTVYLSLVRSLPVQRLFDQSCHVK